MILLKGQNGYAQAAKNQLLEGSLLGFGNAKNAETNLQEGPTSQTNLEVSMIYKCMHCGKQVEIDLKKTKKIICQFCGFRIIEKPKTGISKRVQAI